MSAGQSGATNEPTGSHFVFEEQNYSAWRAGVEKEVELARDCPKTLANIPRDESADQKKAREAEEKMAVSLLFTRLGYEAAMRVKSCSTVREIFAMLDENYGDSSASNVLTIQKELDAVQLNPAGACGRDNRETEEKEKAKIEFTGNDSVGFHVIREHPEYLTNVKELIGDEQIFRETWFNGVLRAPLRGDLLVMCNVNGKLVHTVLRSVLYVPTARENLFTITHFMNGSYSIIGTNDIVTIYENGEPIIRGEIQKNPGKLKYKFTVFQQSAQANSSVRPNETGNDANSA